MDPFRHSAELLKVMAHPERLRLLAALRDGEECVCHLTALLGQRQPYVSQQLSYLRDAGLIRDRKEGLRVYYAIREPQVYELLDQVAHLSGSADGLRERKAKRALRACGCPHCAAN